LEQSNLCSPFDQVAAESCRLAFIDWVGQRFLRHTAQGQPTGFRHAALDRVNGDTSRSNQGPAADQRVRLALH